MEIIKELEKVGKYKFKGVSVPEYYLIGDIKREKVKNSPFYCTVLSVKTYINNKVNKIEHLFDTKLKSHQSPLEGGYHPKVDASALLVDSDKISQYRMLTGSLNWAVTIGRIDVMPYFGYLKYYINASLKMDTLYPEEPVECIVRANWEHLYSGAHEKLPHNAPEPKGKPLRVWGEFDPTTLTTLRIGDMYQGF